MENKNEKVIKDIYDYSADLLKIKYERKRHLEIKILYVLQASALLVALYTGLYQAFDNIPSSINGIVNGMTVVFYISIMFTVVLLLISLDDKIANWFKKGSEGEHEETQNPLVILDNCCDSEKDHYINLINDYDGSIRSADIITEKKYFFFIKGVYGFIFSIVILAILGIIIA